MNVRPEQPADYAAIRALQLAAFAPSTIEAEIVDGLAPTATSCRISASSPPTTTRSSATSMLSMAHVEEHEALGLGPIGVAPERHGAGSARR